MAAEIKPFISELHTAIKELEAANLNHPEDVDVLGAAEYMRDTVIPAMDAVREVADKLEKLIADDLWPLPKYEEMLFIK
jgi:glutamine synthetase